MNILRLPSNAICQHHNMIAFKHLLSANAEHLLFCHIATLCNNFTHSLSPYFYANCVRNKKHLEKKNVPVVRYFDTKIFSSRMKSTLSFISNYSLCTVSTERCQLPMVMSYTDIYKTTLDFAFCWCLPRSVRVSTDRL